MDTSGNVRRRRAGTGPPAAVVITWALLSDPALRSALEYGIARAETARAHGRFLRRRITLATATAIGILLAVRGLLWLLLAV